MDRIVSTGCPHDCGGRCVLKAHVEDGKVVKITTVKDQELRACVRGLHNHKRVYHPDRLKYPLRRTGEKGEGQFERISWDKPWMRLQKG